MTREEAVKIIDCYDLGFYDLSGEKIPADKLAEAFYMATEALQTPPISQRSMYQAGYRQAQEDRPRGEWIHTPNDRDRDFVWWTCSECGHKIFSETEKDRIEFHAYCGRCGADMRGEDDNTIAEAINGITKWRTWSHTYDNACMDGERRDNERHNIDAE